ncbi:AAA family ATPase [Acinetobacter pseudolwoffii]|uniref:AAA family ATPase n=1 Tax=Acinetobacter pseudolwoffii TaxID=2053287 RepID=UPI000C2394C4|nr:ATP-binding protein [Acinetobacter pseudolwoffii]PJI36527.1 ATPase [Acinetobacter pseudolwoffii]
MDIYGEFCNTLRLYLTGQPEDVRLYSAKLIRKYRKDNPDFAESLEKLLKASPTRTAANSIVRESPSFEVMEKKMNASGFSLNSPIDQDTHLSLLTKVEIDTSTLLVNETLKNELDAFIKERKKANILKKFNLKPVQSAIFIGKPGLGKSLSASYLAKNLKLPLYKLDLATIMSSYLGKSGINLKAAFQFAKQNPCVLFLDEIDAIAKTRNDSNDIGELKRIVTVILQELDSWETDSIIIAATNHPELIDRAIWRRFDSTIKFDIPTDALLSKAILFFSQESEEDVSKYLPLLSEIYKGKSFADIESEILKIRKVLILEGDIETYLSDYITKLIDTNTIDKNDLKLIAKNCILTTKMSVNKVSKITGLHRNTIKNLIEEGNLNG